MGILCCLWDLYFEYTDLFHNHSRLYNILHAYYFLSAFVCMMLNVKGLVQEQLPKYDLVFMAYVLTIIQIAVRQADFGGYVQNQQTRVPGDVQYLMFSRGPLLMIMTQSHFERRYKMVTTLILALVLVLGFLHGELRPEQSILAKLVGQCSRELLYAIFAYIMFATWASRVSNELLHQIQQTQVVQDEIHLILGNLEESIIILADGQIEFVNDIFLQQYGLKPEQLEPQGNENDVIPFESFGSKVINCLRTIFNIQCKKQADNLSSDQLLLQQSILTQKIFSKHDQSSSNSEKTETNSNSTSFYTLEEISNISKEKLHSQVYEVVFEECQRERKFVHIKCTEFLLRDKAKKMIQIIDFSSKILYNQEQAKSEFHAIINACVSHELRNPLNSIAA